MGRRSFDNYGERARLIADTTQASARLLITKEQERRILADVMHKLDIQPRDRILDIGCGIGTIGIPLSFLVESYVGIDHPDVVRRFYSRYSGDNVELLAGNFLDLTIDRKFTKILIYSMLHYLSKTEIVGFLERALPLLEPRGLMLIGDMPNDDEHQRFDNSTFGAFWGVKWRQEMTDSLPAEAEALIASPMSQQRDTDVVNCGDDLILGLVGAIRKVGYSCWLLPQPDDLPMWFSREDLLVMKP